MKNYIFGFDQRKLVELNLKLPEILILDYLTNFFGSGHAKSIHTDKGVFYWITYNKILSDLPILNVKLRQLKNIVKNLITKKILTKHNLIKQRLYLKINQEKLYSCELDLLLKNKKGTTEMSMPFQKSS